MRVTVAVPTLRRPARMRASLEAIARLDPPPDEVLVVDGDDAGSAKSAVDAASGRLPVRYLQAPAGLTRQRNAALAAATGDVVVFLDDDAEPAPEALGELLRAYASPDVVGATGRVEEASSHRIGGQRSPVRRLLIGREGTFLRCGYPRRVVRVDVPARVETMSGCFMSARIDVARDVGFDEALTGYALAEDEDFSYRLSRHGAIAYVPTAVVHHDNSGFGERDRTSFNRTVVVHRHYLFRKNFAATPLARLEFAGLVLLLAMHRALNVDFAGLRGLMLGVADVVRGRGPT